MAQKLLKLITALKRPWPLRRGQNYVNICKRKESGGSGVAQKVIRINGGIIWRLWNGTKLITITVNGALEGPWPLGGGQNFVNMCKKRKIWKLWRGTLLN